MNGIINFGNSCYINSALQLLISCSYFTKIILSSNNSSIDFYKQFLLNYFNNKTCSSKNLVQYLNIKRFMDNSQQDSHDFLISLLDILYEKIKKYDINKIFDKLFLINIQYIITCLNCKYQSISHSNENSLILSITSNNLTECFMNYLKPEILEWKCEKCHYIKAKKNTIIKKLPKYLIILVKRYSLQKVIVPKELIHRYFLRSFIVQFGNLSGGHYISFIKNNNQWYLVNDSVIKLINEEQLSRYIDKAYVLLYVNKN